MAVTEYVVQKLDVAARSSGVCHIPYFNCLSGEDSHPYVCPDRQELCPALLRYDCHIGICILCIPYSSGHEKKPSYGAFEPSGVLFRHLERTREISALVSIDMNGLKIINDTEGHTAGDKAISTISDCFLRAAKRRQPVYRVGGDEFVIVCRKISEDEVLGLTKRIHEYVDSTPYSCSVGYSFSDDGKKTVDELLSESDAKMYAEKQLYYRENKITPRTVS
ncbi:MAG: GGDEF domain-containing protein [Saccharofermentans sp.]|nr:GGDEF domain-containing protein [Saccharofermentans sp.]